MAKNAPAKPNDGVNRAKMYQLVLFPLNNGATNVYFVLILSYIAQFGSSVLKLGMFASIMVTVMRVCDAITDPIIGAMMDRTSTKIGKFRPFMILGSAVMAVSVITLYMLTPLIPESMMALRYVAFTLVYFVWVIGYTFQTSCTRAGQTVLTNDPNQRPMFTIFNTIGSMLGMGIMQFLIPLVKANFDVKDAATGALISSGYANPALYRIITPIGIVISIFLTILAIIGIAEKDRPEFYGIGGARQEKVKMSEYVEIIKNNKPMQRLMVAGAGCKLALAIATNTTVLLALYGILMGNYNSLYLPMMVLGYVFAVPFFLLSVRTSQKQGQKASLVRYVSVALICYVGVLILLVMCQNGNPALTLSFPFNGGGSINLYTIAFILCFGMRVLMGVCVGLVYVGMARICKKSVVNCFVTSLSAPLLNTLFFMGYIVLAFYQTDYVQSLVIAKGAGNPLMFVVLLVGVQGVVEAIVCSLTGTAVGSALLRVTGRMAATR